MVTLCALFNYLIIIRSLSMFRKLHVAKRPAVGFSSMCKPCFYYLSLTAQRETDTSEGELQLSCCQHQLKDNC